MKYPKRSQYKYTKKAYRVRNWRAYEQGLCQRGDLTIWLSEEALKAWRARSVRKIVATPSRGVSVVEVEHCAKPRPSCKPATVGRSCVSTRHAAR